MARADVERYILDSMKILDSSGEMVKLYEATFKEMSNSEFEEFITDLKEKKQYVSFIAPNGDNKIKVSEESIRRFFKKERLNVFDDITVTEDGAEYTIPHKIPVLMLPVRRTQQHQSKGIAVSKDNKSRDSITGQVVSDSAAGSITNPEKYVLANLGLTKILDEVANIRGGDTSGMLGLEAKILQQGKVSMKEIKPFRDKTGSAKAVKSYFKAMHIDLSI